MKGRGLDALSKVVGFFCVISSVPSQNIDREFTIVKILL